MKRFCTIGWAFTGLMVAAILAANMSTCSTFMVDSGALFTRNIYGAYLRRKASDRELLLVGRLSGLALTGLGVIFALSVTRVLDAFLFNETLPAFLGIMVAGGLLWRRANRYGAYAATAVSLATYYTINFARTGKLQLVYPWLAAPYGLATLAGVIAFIVVSLATRPEPQERIEAFFENQRRSSDAEAPPGGERPLASERGQDLLLIDLTSWFSRERWRGFFKRYREDLVGFALAWAAVGLLLLAAWALMQIGR